MLTGQGHPTPDIAPAAGNDRSRTALPAPTPECPRCGYDLSGTIASWRVSCPLSTTCTECGLEFDCREVLSKHRAPPRWMFEYGTRPSIARLLKTILLITFRPAWFWRRIQLANPIRARRLIIVAILTLASLHLLHGLAAAAWMYREFASLQTNWVRNAAGTWVAVAMPPPTTAEILTQHWPEFGRRFIWPYSGIGRQSVDLFPAAAFTLIFACATPLAFFALTDTMRACRVRKLHLLRGIVWSLPPIAITVSIGLAFAVFIHQPPAVMLPLLITLPWLAWYWHMFTLRYLRLTHAWGVSLAMITIGLLSTLAFFATLAFTIDRL